MIDLELGCFRLTSYSFPFLGRSLPIYRTFFFSETSSWQSWEGLEHFLGLTKLALFTFTYSTSSEIVFCNERRNPYAFTAEKQKACRIPREISNRLNFSFRQWNFQVTAADNGIFDKDILLTEKQAHFLLNELGKAGEGADVPPPGTGTAKFKRSETESDKNLFSMQSVPNSELLYSSRITLCRSGTCELQYPTHLMQH